MTGLTKDGDGFVDGVAVRDCETGEEFEAPRKVVINATGAFTDSVRRMADPGRSRSSRPARAFTWSSTASFLPGDSAIMVPHTSDGRVMFAIPGTATRWSAPPTRRSRTPRWSRSPFEQEIEFILQTAALYLDKKPPSATMCSACSPAFGRWCVPARLE